MHTSVKCMRQQHGSILSCVDLEAESYCGPSTEQLKLEVLAWVQFPSMIDFPPTF